MLPKTASSLWSLIRHPLQTSGSHLAQTPPSNQDPESSPRIKAQVQPEHMALIPARQNGRQNNQMRQTMVTLAVVLAWYASNIGLLLMNKLLLSYTSFRRPVFLTMCHMVACVALSGLGDLTGIIQKQHVRTRQQGIKIAMLSVAFLVSVVLGNVALKFIPVSFSQAIGATTPAFTALLALVLLGKRESLSTYSALVPVVAGIVLATGFEPSYNAVGFSAAMAATAARALKAIVQGVLLADKADKMDSLNLLRYMAPMSLLLLVPAVLVLEPGTFALAASMTSSNPWFLPFLVLNATTAYLVNLFNFQVTKHTSALTLQVLGNAKGVLAVGVSIAIFKNDFPPVAALGYAVTITGVAAYAMAKRHSAAGQPTMSVVVASPKVALSLSPRLSSKP